MSWHTPGPGSNKNRTGPRPVNTTTGATSMREHRLVKRQQAEARDKLTVPERTRAYRIDPQFRTVIDELKAMAALGHDDSTKLLSVA